MAQNTIPEWRRRALANALPASDLTGQYVDVESTAADDLAEAATLGGNAAMPRAYTVADLQRAYHLERESGHDADDAAERVARSIVR